MTTLAAPPQPNNQLARRDFLKLFGSGLLICLTDGPLPAQESGRGSFGRNDLPKQISAWIHIAADNRVTVFTGKVEVGQNIRTSLAQQVAEELMVPFSSISMVMGDTDLVPFDAGTFGSQTTPTMGPQLRNMAGAARRTLLDLAAKKWSADPASLIPGDGRVLNHNTGVSLTYGELTAGQALTTVVSTRGPFIPASDWKVAGTPVPKVAAIDFVTGKHQFPSDISLPGMLFGKILRPAGFNAILASLDTAAAEKFPGVQIIHDGDLIGVVAPEAHTAEQALAAIHSTWNIPLNQPSNANIFDYFKANARTQPQATSAPGAGSPSPGTITLQQKYLVQYIAHAPLEPRAAVAEWQNGKLTVWTGTQRPFGVRDDLVSHFNLTAAQVRVIQPDMGSAYGGKHTGEAALEAARLSRVAGKPVKLVWTREEEFTWAYLRPGGLIEMSASVHPDGAIATWQHHNYNSGNAAVNTPYNIPGNICQFHEVDSPLRQGSYRGLAATANHFARESFMDELAHAAGMDPLAFRRKNLTDPRIRAVLLAATDKFAWGKSPSTPTRGFGLACGTEKGGYVATCAEVSITPNKELHIIRVVQAWESGAIINPDGLHHQNAGAIYQAIGGALFEAIQFSAGRLLNPHFAQYRLPRFTDMPQIDVVLLDRKDLPSAGAGETGIVGLAPAVGNAIFAATGQRLRNMPMAPTTPVPGIPPSPFRA